ncbi:type I methionyl aminopeptidase [Rubritalea sp.]|uniref:type I methionyl aminopeptidase n=1 Tax=Rubritalea sp. TaxID=2109375 RepID=UPI003EF840F5
MAKRKPNKNKIPIKSPQDIKEMRVACETASEILQATAKFIEAGKTTKEVDLYAAELIKERDCISAFLGYRGFPGNICISPNEEVVHGIGSDRIIKDGDVISIDIGVVKNGWIGDNATTVPVGNVTDEVKRLLAVTEQSLYEALAFAKEGESLADLCGAVAEYVKPFGLGVVKEFVGHGVGKELHEEPAVPNYRPYGRTPRLKEGMVLAVEPMINGGTPRVRILDDGWTVITGDKKYSAHFEHTVCVGLHGPDILTARPREATPELLGITL